MTPVVGGLRPSPLGGDRPWPSTVAGFAPHPQRPGRAVLGGEDARLGGSGLWTGVEGGRTRAE